MSDILLQFLWDIADPDVLKQVLKSTENYEVQSYRSRTGGLSGVQVVTRDGVAVLALESYYKTMYDFDLFKLYLEELYL